MISKFQYKVLKLMEKNPMGLNEIINHFKFKKLEFSYIDALNIIKQKKLVAVVNEKEKYLSNLEFREKYQVNKNLRDYVDSLLLDWSYSKYITTNEGIIAIENYEKYQKQESRDQSKVKSSFNQSIIGWLAVIISIIALIISFMK